MGLHRNARLGLAGRRALVADVESGLSCREGARRRGVSPTTACEWWLRRSDVPVPLGYAVFDCKTTATDPERDEIGSLAVVLLDLTIERPAGRRQGLLPHPAKLRPVRVAHRDPPERKQPVLVDLTALVEKEQMHTGTLGSRCAPSQCAGGT